jgi:acyl-CoA reductase-like NAD-dependent aldehyde dehydrogenase
VVLSSSAQRERVTSYIGGASARVRDGYLLPVVNPATEQTIADLQEADEQEIDLAVAAAKQAFESGPWPRMSIAERKAIFHRIIALTRENIGALAALESANTGQPLRYAAMIQLPRILRSFEFYAESAAQAVDKGYYEDGVSLRYVVREPIGPVALISPSNAPTALAATKIAAATIFGNTCVLKTSESTPLAVKRFVEILSEAGMPPGVVNLVNGRGNVTGAALVKHPDIRAVSFTGGTEAARSIAATAGDGLKRVDLELGGKSANIVLPSADIEGAIDSALISIFTNNGQQCFAGSRIILHREIADAFLKGFVSRAERIRIGDPNDTASENGPLASKRAFDRVSSYVERAKREKCEILTGGEKPAGFDKGYYFKPTVILAPSNNVAICQEEIFGPIASVLVVNDTEEAVRVANESRYGLVSYTWTNNLSEALSVTRRIQAGWCMVNTPMLALDARFPFGGYKDSGLSRESGPHYRDFFTEEKTVTIALSTPKMPKLGMG